MLILGLEYNGELLIMNCCYVHHFETCQIKTFSISVSPREKVCSIITSKTKLKEYMSCSKNQFTYPIGSVLHGPLLFQTTVVTNYQHSADFVLTLCFFCAVANSFSLCFSNTLNYLIDSRFMSKIMA